jgi:capsular exopolysaccharide synthesis family protein
MDISDLGAPNAGTEYTGVQEYLAMVRRKWPIVLIVVAIATGYNFNSVRHERPQYRSRATVRLIDPSRAIAGEFGGAQGNPQMPFSASADPIQSQIQILQSEGVVRSAVDLSGLRLVPADKSTFVPEITDAHVGDSAVATSVSLAFQPTDFSMASRGKSVVAPYGSAAEIDGVNLTVARRPRVLSTTLNVWPKEAAMSNILDNFKVSGRPQTDILDLSYTDFDANQATRTANAMAGAYQQFNKSSAQQFSSRRRAFLESQLKQADSVLAADNQALANFSAGIQSSTSIAAAATTRATQSETQRSELESEKVALDLVLSKPRQSSDAMEGAVRSLSGSPTASSNVLMQQLLQQWNSLQTQRDNLVNAGAAATNPDLIAVNRQLSASSVRILDAAETQRQSVESRLSALDHVSPRSVAAFSNAAVEDTKQAQLKEDVQTAEKLSMDLKQQLQKAKMSEAVEAGQVEIVQLSSTPGYRVTAGNNRKILLGLIVGLMFGFGAAVLADSLDRSIRKRGDIEPLLGIPGLVVIPRLASAGNARRTLPGMKRKHMKALPGATAGSSLDLVTITDPNSSSAEAFRTLRTNLMFSHAVSEMRRLVVTSASPAEGKTVTASNLAVAFAQQGMRVLLIDCDLRRGRLHRVFDLQREPGFSEFVLGYEQEEKIIKPTAVAGLYVITTGKLPPNPAELLGGSQMTPKLDALAEGYDLLIFDSPPLLAASDAAILATICDGVIMVLRAGFTEGSAAQQAMQQLHNLNVRVVGAVLNDPDAQVAKYGAYYRYDYSGSEA